MKHTKCY